MNEIQAVVFDLGGVLVDVRSEDAPRAWARACGVDPDQVIGVYRSDTEYHRLERGEIDLHDYHQIIADRIGRPIGFEEFAAGWTGVFGEVLAGMDSLLASLAKQWRLVGLSNTSAAHADVWRPMYADVLSRLERVFVSHEMGTRKPEPQCYQQVLDYLDLAPAAVAFVDDRSENVRAAESLGMRGIVAHNAEQIAEDLAQLGVKPI